MIYPSIDKLLSKVDSKYSLVVIAARRSRELLESDNFTEPKGGHKTVGIALQEIMEEKITYRRLKDNKIK